MRFLLALFFVIVFAVVSIDGLTQLTDQTASLKKLANTAIVAGPQGPKGPPGPPGVKGVTGARGTSAFPYKVAINKRICTITNLWREGTLAGYEDRLLTYRATPAPFFCKA